MPCTATGQEHPQGWVKQVNNRTIRNTSKEITNKNSECLEFLRPGHQILYCEVKSRCFLESDPVGKHLFGSRGCEAGSMESAVRRAFGAMPVFSAIGYRLEDVPLHHYLDELFSSTFPQNSVRVQSSLGCFRSVRS